MYSQKCPVCESAVGERASSCDQCGSDLQIHQLLKEIRRVKVQQEQPAKDQRVSVPDSYFSRGVQVATLLVILVLIVGQMWFVNNQLTNIMRHSEQAAQHQIDGANMDLKATSELIRGWQRSLDMLEASQQRWQTTQQEVAALRDKIELLTKAVQQPAVAEKPTGGGGEKISAEKNKKRSL